MKITSAVLLGVSLSIHLLAQPAASPSAAPATTSADQSTNKAEPSWPPPSPMSAEVKEKIAKMTPIFDGKTLEGWVQQPEFATTFGRDDIGDLLSLAKKLTAGSDPLSKAIGEKLNQTVKAELTAFTAESTNSRTLKSALATNLNAFVDGPALDPALLANIQLRPETIELRNRNPKGQALMRLNRMLLEDAYPAELPKSSTTSAWVVKEGAMSSTGAGRGTIYTKKEYGNYRVVFTMRHHIVPRPAEHAACVLIFCTTPPEGKKGLDALGGIQFQPPNGGSWDYRPGKNNSGSGLFTRMPHPRYSPGEWFQVELLVNAKDGTARMAVAQPVGTKANEVLVFKDPTAAKAGPLAWQMHNKGLFDEFKDVRVEEDPKEMELITTK